MIGIMCAMEEERDALLSIMSSTKVKKLGTLNYHFHSEELELNCYMGKIGNKEVGVIRCGVGKVYSALVTQIVIQKLKPELVINLGCAGSLSEKVHVGDIVVANRVADWEMDVPGWNRDINDPQSSFGCDEKAISIVKKLKNRKVKVGPIVSGDEFIYKKSQIKTIKKHFPTAIAGEMESFAITNTCYAHGVPCSVIRSISDETLISGNFKSFEFNLKDVCDKAAKLCYEIVKEF